MESDPVRLNFGNSCSSQKTGMMRLPDSEGIPVISLAV